MPVASFLDDVSERVTRPREVLQTLAFAGVILLAALAPFEWSKPIVRLPWQSVSNLEAVLAAAFGLWVLAQIAAWRSSGRSPLGSSSIIRQSPIPAVWAIFVATMTIAALAGEPRSNALHMAGRFAAGFVVYLMTVTVITTPARLRAAMAVTFGSSVIVGLLAIFEYLQVGPVLNLLHLFRPAVSAVGAQLRAGGPLQYPTIASMYLEVGFALGLGLLMMRLDGLNPVRDSTWPLAIPIFGGLLIVAEAIVLTFTRAGLVTMASSLVIVGVARWRRRRAEARSLRPLGLSPIRVGSRGLGVSWVPGGLSALGVLSVTIIAMVVMSRPAQALWLRATSEGQEAWYQADIKAPAEVSLVSNETADVPLRVTNRGRLIWDSADDPPIVLSYHWLLPEGTRVVAYDGNRTPFPAPVPPGSTADVVAKVRAPRQAGTYRLAWDVVQEGYLWFSTEPGAPTPAVSRAIVSGVVGDGRLVTGELPRVTRRPGRFALWRAALRIFAGHPLLGVGPDNFRLRYGSYAGIDHADTRTHSNNMYLEMLVSGGVIGFAAFAWLLWSVATRNRPSAIDRLSPDRRSPDHSIADSLAASLVAIGLHGMVDSFLSFAPTYILFALVVGYVDAHRI